MEELDVMVRTTGAVPRQCPDTERHRSRGRTRRSRPGAFRTGSGTVLRLVPPVGEVRTPSGPAGSTGVPERAWRAAPARAPRTRACLVPSRAVRRGAVGVRSRVERCLVGVAAVLCSAVVVVALGLLADASAGRSDGPGEMSRTGSSQPAWSEPGPGAAGSTVGGVSR